jgi:hypothetical protein
MHVHGSQQINHLVISVRLQGERWLSNGIRQAPSLLGYPDLDSDLNSQATRLIEVPNFELSNLTSRAPTGTAVWANGCKNASGRDHTGQNAIHAVASIHAPPSPSRHIDVCTLRYTERKKRRLRLSFWNRFPPSVFFIVIFFSGGHHGYNSVQHEDA